MSNPGPARFTILTPEEWWRIPLVDPDLRARSIDRLTKLQFRGVDHQPALRRGLQDEISGQAAEAAAAGGLEMYLAVQMRGIPVAATLTTYLAPGRITEGAVEFEQKVGPDGEIDSVQIAAGEAIRRHQLRPPEGPYATIENAPSTTVVDYWIPVPGIPQTLLLTFSSPMEEIAEVMVNLFDSIASSVRWRD
ncbi:MAG: hypothetical protein ACRDO1_10190 [Nocardioidaceae bacterium]